MINIISEDVYDLIFTCNDAYVKISRTRGMI